ncbi:MAG: isoprenylcysteine carboxylmethyltransferase family protein [Planctomycetes bacterium]|nr:isoprenylcysteine carboxylmethyltransferase family protein [Planctomycetota bacterium]
MLRPALRVVLFWLLLFLPAGRLDWAEGWGFFAVNVAVVSLTAAWGWRRDPDLMRERNRRFAPNVKAWDKVILYTFSLLLCALFVVAGLDARFGWSSVPPALKACGWLGLALTFVLGCWAMAVNTFLSCAVRIQSERGHAVVTRGPYCFVRHPLYAGVIVSAGAVPLLLGSWAALAPGGLIAVLFVLRTALEDRTLRRELPGYEDYARRVRFRLLPPLW